MAGWLSPPGRVLDVRPRRKRPRDLRETGEITDQPVPCVMLLSRSCDTELDSVQELLTAAGVRSARLNADELASADLIIDVSSRTACLAGRWLSPTVTWVRHFSARAIDGTGAHAYDMFLMDSWQAVADQLTAISGAAISPQRPGLVAQLLIAQRHRVAVPQTMVTTDPSRAHAIFRCRQLIIKAADRHFVEATPGRLSMVFPMIVERRVPAFGPCHGEPVIVQEFIEHEAELRVYYVHGRVLVFEVGKGSPASLWEDPGRVSVRSVAPPPAVAAATRLLAAAMSLTYGAFDFLVRDGTPVFLEVNPDGDWHWAERKAQTAAVTLAVARMLSDLNRELRTGDDGRSFDLLAFLGGSAGRGKTQPLI